MIRQKKILAILIAVFITSLAYRVLNPYRQERVEKLTYTGEKEQEKTSRDGKEKKENKKSGYAVMLNLFTKPPKHSGTVRSKTFFQIIPGVRTDSKTSKPKPQPVWRADPQKIVPPKVSTESLIAAANEKLKIYQVVGYYVSGNDNRVFLKLNKRVIVIREGDRLEGRYLVQKINHDSVILTTEDIPGELHIEMSELLKPSERIRLKHE